MPPLRYHEGQLAIQREAKTSHVAEKLAYWIGPAVEFALEADLVLLAVTDADGSLQFTILSGKPPLVEVERGGGHALRQAPDSAGSDGSLHIRFLPGLTPDVSKPTAYGVLAINLAKARRARINGVISQVEGVASLVATETFTLCRKYMAPSVALVGSLLKGPRRREPLDLHHPWVVHSLSSAETSFLATVAPDGAPDIAHRGGPAGFIQLDPDMRTISWPEYVGDGIFKSAGNVRATGHFTLLVPDLETGDAIEFVGRGVYRSVRTQRRERLDALVRHKDPFPAQGYIQGSILRAFKLTKAMSPRRRIDGAWAVNSCSEVYEQAPQ